MFPPGHARNTTADLEDILTHKHRILGKMSLHENDIDSFIETLNNIETLKNNDL